MTIQGFWRDTQPVFNRVMLQGFGQLNQVHYLFPQGGGPRGAFTTFAQVKPNLRSRDLIILGGVLREQAVAPNDVYDVTIVGAANQPRQATSGGVPTGGGATWMAPASGAVAATPLIEIVAQGWTFQDITFNPHTSSAGVRMTRSAVTDTIDASHAQFLNCYFLGGGTGQIGIEDNGGCGDVLVDLCKFQLLTGTAFLSLTTAAAVSLGNIIRNCRFNQNTNDIKASLNYALIQWNNFMTAGSGATNKVVQTNFLSAQGNNNHVCHNVFTNTGAAIANASGYNGGNADVWADNYCTDGVDYGIPA